MLEDLAADDGLGFRVRVEPGDDRGRVPLEQHAPGVEHDIPDGHG
jgi:hypothetical protein